MTPRKDRNIKFVAGKYYLDFTFRGRRHREFGGWTKDQARNTLIKMRSELLDVARGFRKAPIEDADFADFADQFLTVYCKPNKRSWRQDELSLENLKAFFNGETLRSIGPALVARFLAERKVEPSKTSGNIISAATCNRELALLKTLFAKAVEWGRIETSPAARVKKLKEPPGRERVATADEIGRLLEVAGPDLRVVLTVAIGTGARRGEILGLKWTDVDAVRGVLTIAMSKSGKARRIPMSGTVTAALGTVPRRGEFVFWNEETKTHVKDVKRAWQAACRQTGIAGLHFHDLRHTALTWMLQSGADIVSVSKIAGHSSIVMTQRYCHASAESQRLAVNHVGGILDSTRRKVDTPVGTVSVTVPPLPSVSTSNRGN